VQMEIGIRPDVSGRVGAQSRREDFPLASCGVSKWGIAGK
jgi:hypothetical protein